MAKKLLFSLLLGVLVLSMASVASAYTIKDGKLVEEWMPAAGWTVTFDVYRPCTCGYFSALGTFGAGEAIATKYNFVNACSLIDLAEVNWTDPGDGTNMVVTPMVWGDDGAGLPDPTNVIFEGTPVSMPTTGVYRMTFDLTGAYIPSAGDYHLGLKEDSTATGWTGLWWGMEHANAHNPTDPLNLSSFGFDTSLDGYPDTWMTNEDLGFDYRWYMRAHGFYDQPTEQVYIPTGIMGPQGATVAVPVYGEFADPEDVDGISFAVWVDGVNLTLDATPFVYTTTDPTYPCLCDVIAFGDLFFWGPYVTATLDSATLGITGDMMGANDWDSPGVYKLFDLIVHVSPTAPVSSHQPIHIENILGLNVSFTHATTDFYPVLISGSIYVPSDIMYPVTFVPPSLTMDEGAPCEDVEVYGGSTLSSDHHTMTVTDWDGADAFGTFVDKSTPGEDPNGHGTFTFCPGYCNSGEYDIVVEDYCAELMATEVGILHVVVNEICNLANEPRLTLGDVKSVWPGADIDVPVKLALCSELIGGYNILIHFDPSVLTLTGVEDKVGLEYFYWTQYQVDDGNKIRIVGIANKPNQVDTPPFGPCEDIIDLYFHVSAKWDPNYTTPISFEVDDPCVDNTMSDPLGYTLYQASENWYWVADHMEGVSVAFCGGGAVKLYKLFGTKVEGVEIEGPYGDVNCDGIAYTIADAVYFMEYLKGQIPQLCEWASVASDINRDGHQWTIADLIMLVNILNGSAEPVGGGKVLASAANITVGNTISTDATIGGIYLTVKGGGEPVLNADGMTMETNVVNGERRIIIVGANWKPATATGALVTIPGSFEVTSVEVSSPEGYLMKVSTVPSEFALAQNYPNPFNPNTNIAFDLPTDANVSLTVYNIAGEKVAELVNGDVKAGHHTVNWNATDVASGVYFYRINAGSYTATRKMVLMK